jgi:CheY-like chemotaxis protein
METIAGRAEVRNLEVPCIVHLGVPAEVTADSRRLGEALGLVLEHAIEHTGCGEVSVRLSLASRAGSIGNLRFEVEDTGTGFTAEDLQTAFEPFHPGLAPNEVASRLAFAKRLIERMGGQMGAESEPGQGTRVWFLVPVEIPDGSESGNSSSSAELAGRRIMIVDDAASQRGALIELAQSLGLDATGCSSGSDTILKLRAAVGASTPFDFVLIDDEVSGLRGSRLVGQIAADPTLGAPALFLAVPYSLRHLVRQPASEGIRGAIAKPIRRDALERLLLGQPGAAEPESKPSEPRAATAAGSPIVLIVEDNLVNQRVAVRLVEKMGYRAAVVSNGREAIQAYLREPYDLILMDCQMPEMDGFTATAEIRRLEPPGARIPVIAMTANAMRGDRERCIAAGMDDYISKPVAFEDLRVLVTRWLARAEVARH